MNIKDLLLQINPEATTRYNSEKFELSERILDLEMEKGLSSMEAAIFLNMSFEEFLLYEVGEDNNTDIEKYHSIISELESYSVETKSNESFKTLEILSFEFLELLKGGVTLNSKSNYNKDIRVISQINYHTEKFLETENQQNILDFNVKTVVESVIDATIHDSLTNIIFKDVETNKFSLKLHPESEFMSNEISFI